MARTKDFKPAEQFYKTKPLAEAIAETSDAIDDLVALVNELKAVHDAHCADTDVHTVADATNVTTLDDVVNGIDTGNLGT